MYPKCVFLVPFKLAPTNGSVMLVRPVQSLNAPVPMLVTLSGIVMFVSPVHPENA